MTKHFNIKRDSRTEERTNEQTDGQMDPQTTKHNAPIYNRGWGIKIR